MKTLNQTHFHLTHLKVTVKIVGLGVKEEINIISIIPDESLRRKMEVLNQ